MDILSAVIGLNIAVPFWGWNFWRDRTHKKRTEQLFQSAACLERHAHTLDSVLHSPAATASVKAALIGLSDLMSDRVSASGVASALCDKGRNFKGHTERSAALVSDLEGIKAVDPDLPDLFHESIMMAINGYLLRWPETAKKFDRISLVLASHPQEEYRFAAEAAWRKSGTDFHGPIATSIA